MDELEICRFCLSKNRSLYNLDADFEIYNLLFPQFKVYGNMTPEDMIFCWECKASLRNIRKFHAKALIAKDTLQKCNKDIKNSANIRTLSTLTMEKNVEGNVSHIVEELENIKQEFLNEFDNTEYCNYELASPQKHNEMKFETANVELEANKEEKKPKKNYKEIFKNYNSPKCKKDMKSLRSQGPSTKLPSKYPEIFERYIMSEKEMLSYRTKTENNKWYFRKEFKCSGCLKGFYNEKDYNGHLKNYHTMHNNYTQCDICTSILPNDIFKHHRESHYVGYKCVKCQYECNTFKDIWRHHTSQHDRSIVYPCRRCDKVLSTLPAYRYHVRNVHGVKVKCEYCDKVFNNATAHKRHLLQHTGMPLHECTICHKSYRGGHGLKTHMKIHEEGRDQNRNAYCAECDVQFKTVYIYRMHLKKSLRHVDDAQQSFTCDQCGKTFLRKNLLQAHMLTHNPVMHECQECSAKYRKKCTLKRHIRVVHQGDKPCRDKVCDICGQGFTTRTILEGHIRTHTGVRPFKCSLCPANFAHKGAMYTHKKLVHKIPPAKSKTNR